VSREALGYTQTTLARLIGSPTSLINNFEAGTRRISIDKALALKRATGLTLEWIYTGDITSLPRPLADRIDSVLKKRKS
jgi:transcriptional regulator with XRE-family HTH domain